MVGSVSTVAEYWIYLPYIKGLCVATKTSTEGKKVWKIFI